MVYNGKKVLTMLSKRFQFLMQIKRSLLLCIKNPSVFWLKKTIFNSILMPILN
jgi:hypothetical protein